MLRTSLLGLTRRLTTAPAWMRPMSTSAAEPSKVESAVKTEETQGEEQPVTRTAFALPNSFAADLHLPKQLTTSLEPYAGRSLASFNNPHTAYKRLNSILFANNVRRELRANMYYEKPNVARRRKNIERNRKLFGAMVRKKVGLIMQMKQRGM
ncbi:hypothetical protein DFQ28_011587 [Apophysomyces sp. BC1034]|nr:hypothetical protein DFQ30_008796 [Apophysomyces sp. BC1015]KAG0191545.1 hypothetical protein DFQ28_011587 [Apophysomyces sp. BC1034]